MLLDHIELRSGIGGDAQPGVASTGPAVLWRLMPVRRAHNSLTWEDTGSGASQCLRGSARMLATKQPDGAKGREPIDER